MGETGDKRTKKREVNSGSFSAGNPRPGPGRGKKKPKAAVSADLLADMERAYSTAESVDDKPIVKAMRNLAHEEPVKFMQEYVKLKVACAGGEGPVGIAGGIGEKEIAVEELAERLLAEWEGGVGGVEESAVLMEEGDDDSAE